MKTRHFGAMYYSRQAVPVLVASLVWVGIAHAQIPEQDTLTREGICRRVVEALKSSRSGEPYRRAISDVRSCSTSAGSILAEQWASPPRDSAALDALVQATERVGDERVYRTAEATLRDQSNPRLERLAALRVLVAYYKPGLELVFNTSAEPGKPGQPGVMIGQSYHIDQTGSDRPLPPDVRQGVLSILEQVGSSDPDPFVMRTARYLADRLRRFHTQR